MSTSKGNRVVLVIVTISLLIFGGLVATEIYAKSHGGYSIDPTDPSNFFTVTIKNDLPEVVKVAWVNTCVGQDHECDEAWTINPQDTIHSQEPRGGVLTYTVADGKGQRLGCLNISGQQSQTHGEIVLDTSKFVTCK